MRHSRMSLHVSEKGDVRWSETMGSEPSPRSPILVFGSSLTERRWDRRIRELERLREQRDAMLSTCPPDEVQEILGHYAGLYAESMEELTPAERGRIGDELRLAERGRDTTPRPLSSVGDTAVLLVRL